MKTVRHSVIWILLCVAVATPLIAASQSPLLAWRQPVYIAAGFAGIIALCLMLVQPLLIGGSLPGLRAATRWYLHRLTGVLIVTMVLAHVGGLWITSPLDVVDAFLLRSPTPFSFWGVLAFWVLLLALGTALLRRKLKISARIWRLVHTSLAVIVVVGTVLHALAIEETMEPNTK